MTEQERRLDIRRRQLALRQQAIARQSQASAPAAPSRSGGRQIVPAMDMPQGAQLNAVGPGPGGFIDPELYRMGAIGRNFDGGPAAQRAGNAGEDFAVSLGSGLVRGATALADLPGQAFGMAGDVMVGGMERAGVMSPEFGGLVRDAVRSGPIGSGETAANFADTFAPGARDYQPQSTAGRYAQTVGEFLPATAGMGPGGMVMGGVLPGIASEAAGQATEGTALEPWARVIAAVGTPTAINFGTNKFRAMFQASARKPTVENLRATKSAAYQAVDDAGEVFAPAEVDGLIARVRTALTDGNYVAGVDRQTDAVLALLDRKSGQPLKLGQLDKIRQNLFKRFDAAKNETGILDAIDAVDDLIMSRGGTNELMSAARLANSRYKKAELLDIAFQRASDQTASTGSSGNILNKYRQAVTSIINNPKQAKWFSPEEIGVMRQFVQGNAAENVLRRVGKLAPGGNGLMLALNLGAAAVEPMMLGVTAAASAAKATADSMATRNAGRLMDMVSGQPMPRPAPRGVNALAPGLSAILNQ